MALDFVHGRWYIAPSRGPALARPAATVCPGPVHPAIQTDDDILMLAASHAARAGFLLTNQPVTDQSIVSARAIARDLAAGFFLGPGRDDPMAGISIVATTLAGAYALRLSRTLEELVRGRSDYAASAVLGDAYHLCRHLQVPLSAPDPGVDAPAHGLIREHLRAQISATRAPKG